MQFSALPVCKHGMLNREICEMIFVVKQEKHFLNITWPCFTFSLESQKYTEGLLGLDITIPFEKGLTLFGNEFPSGHMMIEE